MNWLTDWLNRLPQPWDMVVGWLVYLTIVATGFAISYSVLGLL